jgi:competence protein ComEC
MNTLIMFIILFTDCFLSQRSVHQSTQAPESQIYEAERAQNNGLVLLDDSTASSGKFLRMRDSGSISWKVLSDTSQWHELIFRYRAYGGEKEENIIRNGFHYAVGFGIAKDWSLCTTRTYLHKGENTVELKEGSGPIDIDYLKSKPVYIKPTIKPLNNIYYREYPRDLFFTVKRFGRHIQSVTCGARNIRFELSDFTFYEDAVVLKIPREEIIKLDTGKNILKIHFNHHETGEVSVQFVETRKPAGLTIIVPDVGHGSSVLMILPTKKTLLIDCGQDWVRDRVVIPLIQRLGIDTIDYFIITHYHRDHDGGDRGKKIINLFHVENVWDYKSFQTGDEFPLEGTHLKIINSYNDGDEENTRSLSFRMNYNGFVYVHGGDTYEMNQRMMMKRFPNEIEAEVFFANHHFHGSMDVGYVRALNPVIVLLQAQEAIYARNAYMDKFKMATENYFIENNMHYIEDLPAIEVGTVIIRVSSKSDWSYETSKITTDTIPFLLK